MWSDSPAEAKQLYNGLLVGNHVEAVELHVSRVGHFGLTSMILLDIRALGSAISAAESLKVDGGVRSSARGRAVRRASQEGEGGVKLLGIGSWTRLRRAWAGR